MIACGVDIGSLTAQAVLVDDAGAILAHCNRRARPSPVDSAREVLDGAAAAAVGRGDIGATVATGYGRQKLVEVGLARAHVSEISCHGAGAFHQLPGARTVIDIGGQDAKVIRLDPSGELGDFVMNDKCASGTGRFLEVMARTLEVDLERLGQMALQAAEPTPLSARCSIFCETEVLHHLQRGVDAAALAAGICRAMADRVAALTRRLGAEPAVTMTGGVAKNDGVRRELERLLGQRLVPLPRDPQVMGALGAALHALRGAA